MENDDLNGIAAAGRGQQKSDASPQLQRRTTGLKTRSPSPARRTPQSNGGSQQQQQQKVRTPVVSTAAKHCHECGEPFPVEWAKFCCECGEKRLGL
jgi:membrane protease subunit (stomatin/prohibitin family)